MVLVCSKVDLAVNTYIYVRGINQPCFRHLVTAIASCGLEESNSLEWIVLCRRTKSVSTRVSPTDCLRLRVLHALNCQFFHITGLHATIGSVVAHLDLSAWPRLYTYHIFFFCHVVVVGLLASFLAVSCVPPRKRCLPVIASHG